MPKRSRFEIYIDVLVSIKKGRNRVTPIMYQSNLSYKPTREILDFLIKRGLIASEASGNSTFYQLTPKGVSALSYFEKTKQLIFL